MHRAGLVRLVRMGLVYLLVAAAAALGWLWHALPGEICLEPGQTLQLPRFAWVEPLRGRGSRNVASTRAVGSYQVTLALGGWLPVRTIRAVVTERPTVTVCGTPFGVKMFSEGALVVGFSDVNTAAGPENPAKAAGLRLGDRVIRIGSTATEDNDAVKQALEAAQGGAVEVVYVRSGEQRQTSLTPVWDASSAQWRAGMWVRDSSAGVGTMTFVDRQLGVFAGLGHPISDSDTGESVALRSGEIVACSIVGCTSGTIGSPGELKGKFLGTHALGSIGINGPNGVYGTLRTALPGETRELAFAQEVVPGEAEIWATTEGETPRAYKVRIEKVNDADPRRNMILRVTDPALLAKTGGIVQGMSGSPILQNGRLVGAVTHVLVNDPTRGYGIFAQTMLEQAKYARQSGGKGQYGHVKIRLEPNESGKGYEFVNEIVGGAIPKEYIPAVDAGIQGAMESGILAGYPVVDVKVTLYDGSYHEVDSSEMAFKIAGSMAFKEACRKANPCLLEPIMKVSVIVPEDYMGDVIGDLNSRRGQIQGMEARPGAQQIDALVPLSEMFGYATDLRSRTQGRGQYSMEPHSYVEIPKSITDKIVEKRNSAD